MYTVEPVCVTVLGLHGTMNQLKRVAVYNEFCRKKHAVLFATEWNLSNPTHQGTREMCRIAQDVRKTQVFFLVNRNLHKLKKRRNCVCLIM
jgi:hypothetical protein